MQYGSFGVFNPGDDLNPRDFLDEYPEYPDFRFGKQYLCILSKSLFFLYKLNGKFRSEGFLIILNKKDRNLQHEILSKIFIKIN